MQIFHLTFSSTGRWPLFDSEASRRAAVRLIAIRARGRVVLFCIVDDHLHVVVLGDRAAAGRIGRALLYGLRTLAACPVEPAYIRPVRNRSHMAWLVEYLLGQPRKHGLSTHPALWSGSCFADLVGARCVPGLELRIFDVLPRLTRADIHRFVELPDQVPLPDLAELYDRRMRLFADAGAAAAAADPGYDDRSAATTTARRIAARLGSEAHIAVWRIACGLGVSDSMVRRLRIAPLDPRFLLAGHRQIALALAVDIGNRAGAAG